jgi:cyclase
MPDRQIDCDMSFDLGGCEAQILLAPGHTRSNICVWVPSDGVLFSGDSLVNGYLPNLECGGISDWHVWLESLARLRQLNARSVVPGHGAVAHGADVSAIFVIITEALGNAIAEGRAPTTPQTAFL